MLEPVRRPFRQHGCSRESPGTVAPYRIVRPWDSGTESRQSVFRVPDPFSSFQPRSFFDFLGIFQNSRHQRFQQNRLFPNLVNLYQRCGVDILPRGEIQNGHALVAYGPLASQRVETIEMNESGCCCNKHETRKIARA